MKTGLFIGRFQPLHNEHFRVIKGMFDVCDRVVIGIGSMQKHGTETNPFTYLKRSYMITNTINAYIPSPYLCKLHIVGIPDIEDDNEWISNVKTLIGDIDVAFTGNAHTKSLFKKQGIKVIDIKRRPTVSGTIIRKRMASGKKWKHMVPKPVVEVIKK